MDQLDVATEIEVFYVLFHQSLLMIFITRSMVYKKHLKIPHMLVSNFS